MFLYLSKLIFTRFPYVLRQFYTWRLKLRSFKELQNYTFSYVLGLFSDIKHKNTHTKKTIHTPLLLRKSIKSCLVRNFTAGDCEWLEFLDEDAEDVDGPEDEEGSDEVDGKEAGGSGLKVEGAVEVDGAGGADGVEELEATGEEEADVAGR